MNWQVSTETLVLLLLGEWIVAGSAGGVVAFVIERVVLGMPRFGAEWRSLRAAAAGTTHLAGLAASIVVAAWRGAFAGASLNWEGIGWATAAGTVAYGLLYALRYASLIRTSSI